MSEPTVSTTTERLYQRLPEVYRTRDAENGWAFKKWLDGIGSRLDELDTLRARFTYVKPNDRRNWEAAGSPLNTYDRDPALEDPEIGFDPVYATSDLLDGRTADAAWLPWIGQLVGSDLSTSYTDVERRNNVVYAFLGYRAGSRASLRNAVLEELTGTKYLQVFDHSKVVGLSSVEPGTEWEVTLVTKPSETPGGADIVGTIERKGAKPAGVKLYHFAYTIIWNDFEARFTTWNDIEAMASWDELEATTI